jgi:hypothetical protein
MTAHPPTLHFLSVIMVEKYSGPSRVRVLVPLGHEDEAARLVERYQTEVIDARKRSLESLWNPPEPL